MMTEALQHSARGGDERPVLDIRGLEVEYRGRHGGVTTVNDFTLAVTRGVIYGVVGESGSGKSTVGLAGIGWASPALNRLAGRTAVLGEEILDLPPRGLRKIWGRHVGYVPQEVGGALHPSFRIRRQFRESLRINRGVGKAEADARAIELLQAAGIPEPQAALKRYPHEFSGGQLQRIAIALALAPRPDLLVLDEPTTGLDVTTQRIVVDTLRKLATEERVAVLFISHDIALLGEYADELVVMYAGEIVEQGPVASVLSRPRHPYTRALVDAVPSPGRTELPASIPGLPPGRVVEGSCAFAPRCSHAAPQCVAEKPELIAVSADQAARCCRLAELNLGTATHSQDQTERVPGEVILTARDIVVDYGGRSGVRAVDEVSLTLRKGNLTALVGESGSGKSSLGHVIAGLRRPTSGSIEFDGVELPSDPMRRSKLQRRRIQLVFQSTAGSLNPRRRVGDHLNHVAACFLEPARRQAAVEQIMDSVQLSNQLLNRYPSELSGGQKQRVAIASAFLADPAVVVCDEITSGQDVSVQAAILETVARMQATHDTAVLLISHDLGVVRAIADDLYVMRGGVVVEEGRTADIFANPQHEYTRALLAAAPHALDTTTSTPQQQPLKIASKTR
jgi:peptide/nickel transport system ATP-binding protein